MSGERNSDSIGDGTRPPASVGGSPVEVWVTGGSPLGWGHWQQQSWKVLLGISPLRELTLSQSGIDPRAETPQAKQVTRRECSPTYQRITGLKFYWAWPCLPDQDPVFPTTSPSHQETYTSLLASSTRRQTEEARRTTIPQWLEQKPRHRKLIRMKK